MKNLILLFLFILLNYESYGQLKYDSIEDNCIWIKMKIKILNQNDTAYIDSVSLIRSDFLNLMYQDKSWIERESDKWIPSLSFIIALITIIYGWNAIQHNRKIKMSELLQNFTTEYASEEMLDALIRLRNWQKENSNENLDFSKEFARLRETDYDKVKALDIARRKVSHFYNRIYLLNVNKVLNKKEISKIVTRGEIDLLLELIEPLETSINKDADHRMFTFFLIIKSKIERNEKTAN